MALPAPLNTNFPDEDDVGEIPILSPTASAQEIVAYNLQMQTLAQRRRRRHEMAQQQILEDAVATLRVKVAKLRDLRSDWGLPPCYMDPAADVPPPGSIEHILNNEDVPRPHPAPAPPPTASKEERVMYRRAQSMLAAWQSRRRKRIRHQMLVYEVAALKVQMPPVGR